MSCSAIEYLNNDFVERHISSQKYFKAALACQVNYVNSTIELPCVIRTRSSFKAT